MPRDMTLHHGKQQRPTAYHSLFLDKLAKTYLPPIAQLVKKSVCNAGDLGSIPGLGRSRGEGKGYPLQYCDLENSMDYVVQGSRKESDTIE